MAKKKNKLDHFDKIIGIRIRKRRNELGMRRKDLAVVIGVTQQQIHKYELGTNRTSASMLYQISLALGVDVSYFYQELSANKPLEELSEQQRSYIELSKNFSKINNRDFKKAISNLVKTIAGDSAQEETVVAENA